MEYQSIDDIDSVTQLLKSDDFKDSMLKIKDSLGVNPKPWFGLVEQNPEYQLVVKANELCAKIDDEIAIVHKFVQVFTLNFLVKTFDPLKVRDLFCSVSYIIFSGHVRRAVP